MSEIIVHKPAGVTISEELLAKIRKEYTGPEVFHIYRNAELNEWFYSEKAAKIVDTKELFVPENESIILFNKTHTVGFLPNPVDIQRNAESWFITCGVGFFPFLIAQNDKGAEIMFDNFLKFLDIPSLHGFLLNMCKNYRINYVSTVNGQPIRRYGNWNEIEGVFFSDTDFYYKIEYAAKSFLKNVLAFFSNPEDPKAELARLEKLSDLSLRQECEKVPNLLDSIKKL